MFRGEPREPAVVLILELITCGIYTIYWHYKTSQEIQLALGRTDETSPGMEILLMLITCGIYTIYWWYKYGKMVAELRTRHNLPPNDNAILHVVLCFVLPPANPLIMQGDLNQIWRLP